MLRFHSPVTQDECGSVLSAVLIDSHALAVFGTTPRSLPSQGIAVLSDGDEDRGNWHSVSWSRPDDNQHGFFAILGVDTVTQIHSGTIRVSQGNIGPAETLPSIGRVDLDPALLIAALQDEGAPVAAVLNFLHGVLSTPEFKDLAGLEAFRASALESLSKQSGFAEIITRPECGGLLVQGWSCALAPGFRDVIVQHETLQVFDGVVALFEREDLLETASGFVVYFKDADGDSVLDLRRLYFSVENDYFHLEVVPEPVRFDPPAATAHLAQTLPVLQGDQDVFRAFKRICRPRFEGTNTMAEADVPVRLSLDCAFHVTRTGIFLSGWLLDPRQSVSLVLLKSTGNFYQRIHENWYRTTRPDVISGYAEDPLFAPFMTAASDQCGFLTFVPHEGAIADDEQFYVEIVLDDDGCVFLPVTFDTRAAETITTEILGTVDVDDIAFESLVRAHLGPIVSGAFASRDVSGSPATVRSFGHPPNNPRVSVIMPSTSGNADLDINLSRFAGDPDFKDAELIMVVNQSDLQAKPEQLREWAEFYGLSGKLLIVDGDVDYFDALEIGTQQAGSSLLAFLADTVLPDTYGWLGRLADEIGKNVYASAISPTLLYEDLSIGYAGLPIDDAPSLEKNGLRQLTGYPMHWLADRDMCEVHGISEQCVLIRRDAFEQIRGFSREFTGPDVKGIDFSLRLRHAGMTLLWTPAVTLYCLDSGLPQDEEHYWRRPAQRIDSWRLSEKWLPTIGLSGISHEVVE